MESRRLFTWFWAGLAAVCCAGTAQALDPNRAMSEYIRDRWDAQQGFPGGPVYAITQTADGYLWIGTEKGLVRFDGLTFRLFNHTNSTALPAGPVLGMMSDAEGNLWIRPQSRNMLRYRDGTFQDVMPDLEGVYQDARLVVCPVRSGGGTRIKIIEAAMYGRAVVSTACARW